MTKSQFLDELRKELKLNNVADIDEIIAEYEEHFSFKIEEGLSEEEISHKLSSPKEIAKDYAEINVPTNKNAKKIKVVGLSAISVPAMLVYIIMWSSVLVLGTFSLLSVVIGFCLITTINIAGLIPSMPYFPAFMGGITMFALSVLSAIGTIYLFLYVKQWGKVYLRWCKNIANNSHYPSLSKHPKLSKRVAYKLKLIAIISLIVLVSCFAICYFSMCIAAHNMEPWHVWNWFVK